MRIIVIKGLFRLDSKLEENIALALREQFTCNSVIIEGLRNCWPYEIPRMLSFIEYLAETYDDGIETLFVAHSMGGIFACALDRRFLNSPIRGIATVFSPHTYWNGIYPLWLGGDHLLKAPIITFEAKNDMVVLWGSWHRQSLEHTVLQCNHRTDLENDDLRFPRRIAEMTWRYFA